MLGALRHRFSPRRNPSHGHRHTADREPFAAQRLGFHSWEGGAGGARTVETTQGSPGSPDAHGVQGGHVRDPPRDAR